MDAGTETTISYSRRKKTYVRNDLKGDDGSRRIPPALLNNLGFYGETVKYSDGAFYAGANTTSHLSEIDRKAAQLMYGKKITNRIEE